MTTQQFLGIIKRRGFWILLCFAVAAAAAYGYSKRETEKYTATASVTFTSNPLGQQIAGLPVVSGATSSSGLVAQQANNIEVVTGGNRPTKIAHIVGRGVTPAVVSESLRISGKSESNIVEVSATSTSPVLATAIANTYVNQFAKEQQGITRHFLKAALAVVHRQLAALSPAQRVGSDGLDLQNRAHTLGLLVGLSYNDVQLAQEASRPSSPSSPRTKRNTILGAIVGLLLGLAIALFLEHSDRRIRRPEDLEYVYGIPRLGDIPKSAALSRSRRSSGKHGAALPPADAEAFSLIRAHLRSYNSSREIRTVMVVSPAPNDGKTTLACHLAQAATRSGARALLLEADLRRPAVAQQLGIQAGPGLVEVLIGDSTIEQAARPIPLATGDHAPTTRGHTLDVLTAGAAPPLNPGELLESQAMHTLLERLKAAYDLVVIDTPPLNAISDTFPLLMNVDGVVIVGWIGRSRYDAAEELHKVLVGCDAPLLGVVANGTKPSGLNSYARSLARGTPTAAQPSDDSLSSEAFAPAART